jgi:hypothetical protein
MLTLQFALDFTQKLPASTQERIADGMRQADENADLRWRHIFDGCVLAAARKKSEITSDDVLAEIEALPDPPNTPNLAAIGPAIRVKRSERPEKHGNRQNIWISKCWKPD